MLLSSVSLEAQTTRARYLMGTICTVSADTPQHADVAFDEIARIETWLSTWKNDSALSQLNRSPLTQRVEVPIDLGHLLLRAMTMSDETNGAFNPLVRPLIDAWKTREEGALPSAAAIRQALARMDVRDLTVECGEKNCTVTRRADVVVEEGAFGKGYALDRAVEKLRNAGVHDALLDFGGQLASFGQARNVAIASPDEREKAVVTLQLADASLSTSSGSEKHFTIAGRTFTHIFDPRTGEALEPRGSVSVVAADAFTADVLSTALYVMGAEDGTAWADAHDVAAVFILPIVQGRGSVRLTKKMRSLRVGLQIVDSHFTLKD